MKRFALACHGAAGGERAQAREGESLHRVLLRPVWRKSHRRLPPPIIPAGRAAGKHNARSATGQRATRRTVV